MSVCGVGALGNARTVVEDRIGEYYQAIIQLKRQLNTMTLISRLPNEILSGIFVLVARTSFETPNNSRGYRRSRRAYPWLKVTHVCHSWRVIAHNTPRFWSFLVLIEQQLAKEFLCRSKEAPLHIATSNLHASRDIHGVLREIFASDPHRLKEFWAFGAANDICKFFAAHARRPVGILDKLVLKDVLCDDSGRYQTAILPADIFQGHHPVLRHLEIHHVVFKWDNPIICASLTTLVLRLFSSFNRSHTSTFEEVLSALEKTSNLRDLELYYAIPRSSEDNESVLAPSRIIALPRLRSMRLTDDQSGPAHLLSHLALPSQVSLKLTQREASGL